MAHCRIIEEFLFWNYFCALCEFHRTHSAVTIGCVTISNTMSFVSHCRSLKPCVIMRLRGNVLFRKLNEIWDLFLRMRYMRFCYSSAWLYSVLVYLTLINILLPLHWFTVLLICTAKWLWSYYLNSKQVYFRTWINWCRFIWKICWARCVWSLQFFNRIFFPCIPVNRESMMFVAVWNMITYWQRCLIDFVKCS